MVVLGVAVAIVVLFGVLSVVSSQGPTTTTTAPSVPARVHGTSLRAVAAARALKPIEHPETPPANIVDALTLPQGAVSHGYADNTTAANQYDEQMRFSVEATEADVVDFYRVELAAKGWKIEDVGPATNLAGGTEVLAEKGGDDGWYWEVGAVVSPSTFGASGSNTTAFTLRLFQVSDDF
jgi:hypothetical protein